MSWSFAGDAFQSEDDDAVARLDVGDALADANRGNRETFGVAHGGLAAVRHTHHHNVRARLWRTGGVQVLNGE